MCYRRENLLQREIPVEKIDLYYNLDYITIDLYYNLNYIIY